jgi:predicted N-acetyltransferase YhbS
VSVTCRAATADDVDAVLAVWKEAAGPSALADHRQDIERLLDRAPGSLLMAEDDGEILGTIIAGFDGWRGSLARLAVVPSRRTEGLGRLLVAEAEKALREWGCPRVTALVHLELGDAAPFWSKVGYDHDTEVGRFVRNL